MSKHKILFKRMIAIILLYNIIFLGLNGCYFATETLFFKSVKDVVFSKIRIMEYPKNEFQNKNYMSYLSNIKSENESMIIDPDVYCYDIDLNIFYQYKTCYVLGSKGFWIIRNEPFRIKLMKKANDNFKIAKKLGKNLVLVNSEKELTDEEYKNFKNLEKLKKEV